jgi:peptide/nickel transport system substrate-binding protein
MLFALLISAIPIMSVSALDPPNNDTLIIATAGNAESCDPAWHYDTASGELIQNVYEGLMWWDYDKVDQYVPMIAESWPGSDVEGRKIVPIMPPFNPVYDAPVGTAEIWLFKIKNDIPWQNPIYGHVTPQDVEYTFERGMVQDHDGGPQWMLLSPLLGIMTTRPITDPAALGHAIDNSVHSNATHVWFCLKIPFAAFQQILCQTWSVIMSKEWRLADPNDDDWHGWDPTYTLWVNFNDPAEPGPIMDEIVVNPGYANAMMGTGPYMLDYWDTTPAAGMWRLKRFDCYWRGWDVCEGSQSMVGGGHPHVTWVIEKMISEWSTRKAYFISEAPEDQVDLCFVPRANVNELMWEFGIRYKYDLPTLAGNGFFFNYNVDALSTRIPTLGGVPTRNLFSDRHMRLAFSYAFNVTDFIASYMLGEAFPIGNPIIQGIAYYNATKPYYGIDLAKVQSELMLAWSGVAWASGFTVEINFNTGNTARQLIATMVAGVINGFKPGSCTVVGIPWATYLAEMYNYRLCAWMLGWQADFPDPHNWMQPFMHTQGDFSGFQNIQYGLDPSSMNWKDYRYGGGFPYTNWNGTSVAALSNYYVDWTIEHGIKLPMSDPLRKELYEELMDIFFAEDPALMTYQGMGRHYERDWVQGWYYNIMWPGVYAYDLWKQWKEQMNYELSVWSTKNVFAPTGQTVITIGIEDPSSLGTIEYYTPPIEVLITVKIYINWKSGDPQPIPETHNVWVFWGDPFDIEYVFNPTNPQTVIGYYASIIPMYHWVDCYTMLTYETGAYFKTCTMDNYTVSNSAAPDGTGYAITHKVCGDLGGFKNPPGTIPPPYFFAYDGIVDSKDLALWLMAYKNNGPF